MADPTLTPTPTVLNDRTSTLSLLATRRSGKPRDMIEPGPDAAQLRSILSAAMRVPDHGKLAPWRFVVVGTAQRDRFETMLTSAYRAQRPDAGRLEIEAVERFARQAPALVVVLSAPVTDSKIPRWEQELSTGAAIQNLLVAAHASGFVASWLTGWAAYDSVVRDAFGCEPDRIAGFIFMGSAAGVLEERVRPDYDTVVCDWG